MAKDSATGAANIPYASGNEPSLVSVPAYHALVDRVNVLSKPTVIGGTFTLSAANCVLNIDAATGGGGGGSGYETEIMKLENGTLRLYHVLYTTVEDVA